MSEASRVVAGRYRLVAPIGAGGMGAVWRAQDELLGVEVALKEVTLGDDLTEGDRTDRITRAMREARSAARLRSNPHVVTVHDAVEHGGLPWIVMELVASVSLHDAVRDRGPLPAPEVAHIGLAVLDALAAAHALGVRHRDVKPSNILLADDGRVLLTDFGIATHEADSTLTRTGYVGTPRYMAPERLDGRPATPATDLFALGGTLYFAVEGRPPFLRDSAAATIGAIMFVDPDAAVRAGPLGPVLSALLAKPAEDRPSVGAVQMQLAAVAAGSAPPPLQRAATASAGGPTVVAGAGYGPRTPPGPYSGDRVSRDRVASDRVSGGSVPPPPGPPDRAPAVTADQPAAGRSPARTAGFAAAAVLAAAAVVVAVLLLRPSSGNGPGPAGGPAGPAGPVGQAVTAAPASAVGTTSDGTTGGLSSDGAAQRSRAATGPGTRATVVAAFVGTWRGTVHQGDTSYDATVVLRRGAVNTVVGTSDYPSLQCRSQLTLLAATRARLDLEEKLVTNAGLCTESALEIDLRPDGTLRYSYPSGPLWSAGEATLRRG